MTVNDGDVFKNTATASQRLLLQFQALASAGSGAVLTPLTENDGAPSRRSAPAGAAADMMRFIIQQQHDEQVRMLSERLADLDRRTDEALRRADERLAEILRTANRTKDGRAAFLDEDGKIYDEHDNEVGADEIDWDRWNSDAWKRRDFQGAAQAVKIATELHNDVLRAQDDLANRPTGEALAALTLRAESLEAATEGLRESGFRLSHPVVELRSTSAAKEYAGYTLGTPVPLRDPFAAVAPPPTGLASTEQPAIEPTLGPLIAPK